jgi:hypothetical protein
MATEKRVGSDVINHNQATTLTNLVTDRRLDLEFTAGFEPERYFVADGAGHPAVLGDAGHSSETKAGGAAHHLENFRNGINPANRREVVRNGLVQVGSCADGEIRVYGIFPRR